jgi:hypothetical protein
MIALPQETVVVGRKGGKLPSFGRGSRARRRVAARWGDRRSRGRLGLRFPEAYFHSGDAYRTTGLDAAIVPPRANAPDNRHFRPVEARGTPYALSEIQARTASVS